MKLNLFITIFSILLLSSCIEGASPRGQSNSVKDGGKSSARVPVPFNTGKNNSYSNGYGLHHYVNEYKEAHLEHTGRAALISSIRIKMVSNAQMKSNFKETYSGVCFGGLRDIWINQEHWDKKDDFERRSLIFHEYGHCHLRRDHNSARYNGHKLSLLHPYVSWPMYERYTWEYDEELFTGNSLHLKQVL
ncbi:MAG: hypothetical protein ACJAT2_002221 [Bacteriovoracaceae bacterium]|jgi:hypothetical protein